MLRIVEVLNNVLVLISEVATLNWSDTIYPNLGYPVKNAENRHFCTKSDLRVFYPLMMFLKLMLRIVGVPINVLVLISQVAALNWSDAIDPNLGYPRQKRRKSTFCREKWSERILSISDVPETYVRNSWGPNQRFGINQPSGRAQLKWHHIPKLRVPPSKTPKIDIFAPKSDLKELYPILMLLKLMLRIVEVLSKRFGINQPSGRAQLKWHHIPKLRVTPSKTPKIDIFARKVIWKYFIH